MNNPFIQVYDDLIPTYLQDHIEFITMGAKSNSNEFVYPTVDFKCKYESTAQEINQPPLSFVHLLKSHTTVSRHLDNFGMIPIACCNINNFTLKNIMMARVFITVPHNTDKNYYAPHIDLEVDHMVVIYFVNDADGPTVFFDEAGNIIQSIAPKKGRAVMFDGKIKHGGGIPKSGPRCLVNYDIQIKK